MKGKDVAFNELGAYWSAGANRNWTGYIYTDRPVYRPGDTVHFRGILRKQAVVGYETPSSEGVQVEITDPDGKNIYQKTLTTNVSGIIHDELSIDKSSALGNFYVQVHGDESIMSGTFEIQEYKKPEYEVHVTPEKTRLLEGETVKAVIDSKYYFGEPVAGAKVSYSIHRSRYWFPFWYEADEEMGGEEGDGGGDNGGGPSGEEIDQGQGVLDADGKLTISVRTAVSDQREDYTYRIEAGVTDKAGREISGTRLLTATYGTINIFVQPTSYVITPGSATTLKISARDYDNKPVATLVHVQLDTWNWHTGRSEGNATHSEVTTGGDGTAIANVNVPAGGGEIRVLITAKAARTVEGTSYLWAPGAGFDWGFSNQRTLKVVADRRVTRKARGQRFF